ncbi:MAG TPA: sulfite exporter TauE/SafE family protein [Micropepsaceae bacterium]|nr:sulfite exporter TauE/SafE family protein [Micropepsaceae bacterium]
MIYPVAAAVLCGAAVGFSLGLIGGGGSILAVPLLLYVVGITDPHVAIGTSALAVSINAFANLFGHWRAGTVHWPSAVLFGLVGVSGAVAGSSAGKAVDGQKLLVLFAIVMIAAGIAMLRPWSAGQWRMGALDRGRAMRLVGVGGATGFASGFFGIGGGFLVVPGISLATGMPILNAIGCSLFSVAIFGLATAANYAFSGMVAWSVAAEFIAGGAAGGWVGTKAAVRLAPNKRILSRILAAVIFAVAAYMLVMTAKSLNFT